MAIDNVLMMKRRVIMYELLTGSFPFLKITEAKYDSDGIWSERAKYMLNQMKVHKQNAKSGKADAFGNDLKRIKSKKGMMEALAEINRLNAILALAKRLLVKMLQWNADDRPDAQQALNDEVCLPEGIPGNFNIDYRLIVVQGQARGYIFKQQASCLNFVTRRGKAPQGRSARLSEHISPLSHTCLVFFSLLLSWNSHRSQSVWPAYNDLLCTS